MTPCSDLVPNSDKISVTFDVAGVMRVGRYHPTTEMFHTAGSPSIKYPLAEVSSWRPLIKNPDHYLELLRKEPEDVRKSEEVVAVVSSLSHVVDLRLTGRRRANKAVANGRKRPTASD